MSADKFTQGPWHVMRCNRHNALPHIRNEQGLYVMDARGNSYARIRREADARLIASAPDLLQALRDIAASTADAEFECGIEYTRVAARKARRIARAAIARAIGESGRAER